MAGRRAPPFLEDSCLDKLPLIPAARGRSGAIRGGATLAASRGGRHLLRLGITILLARLLSPEEFGAVAVITAVMAIAMVLQQAGLSAATVQREEVSLQAVSTLFWINSGIGAVLTLLLLGLADTVAVFYAHPELAPLCRVAALSFLLNGLVVQHRALLQRNSRFRDTAVIEMLSALAGGAGAIALALGGRGYWALIGQILITDVVALMLLVKAVRWRLLRPALSDEVRQMLRFGVSLLGFNLVVGIAQNLHVVLLGRGVGTAAAGIYTRAFALASIPQALLQTTAAYVALPKLSRSRQDEVAFASFYYDGLRLLSLVTLPVALAFALFGEQIALLVYGRGWGEVAELLRIFSLGLAVAPLLHSTGQVFLARGESHRMLRWGLFGACVIGTGSVVGLRWGMPGIAWGWSATTLLLLYPCLAYAYRGSGLTVPGAMRAVAGIYGAALCSLPPGWLLHRAVAGLPLFLELAAGLGGCLLIYAALCYFVFGQKALISKVAGSVLHRGGNR